jgi:antitoxin component of MazEF toxin-antitoxin module
MKAQLVKIGNSRGIRLPQKLLTLYRINEGDELELEERRDGILLRPGRADSMKLSFEASYREMIAEPAEHDEWSDWDSVSGDGLHA